eukprot:IDg9655t1
MHYARKELDFGTGDGLGLLLLRPTNVRNGLDAERGVSGEVGRSTDGATSPGGAAGVRELCDGKRDSISLRSTSRRIWPLRNSYSDAVTAASRARNAAPLRTSACASGSTPGGGPSAPSSLGSDTNRATVGRQSAVAATDSASPGGSSKRASQERSALGRTVWSSRTTPVSNRKSAVGFGMLRTRARTRSRSGTGAGFALRAVRTSCMLGKRGGDGRAPSASPRVIVGARGSEGASWKSIARCGRGRKVGRAYNAGCGILSTQAFQVQFRYEVHLTEAVAREHELKGVEEKKLRNLRELAGWSCI